MYGAIVGDIIGSAYESNPTKDKHFPLFTAGSTFTDDTVMTLAIAHALSAYDETEDLHYFRRAVVKHMIDLGNRYPDRGYGHMFARWLDSADHTPYGSFGNGSAMRVSPVAWYATSLMQAEALAEASADVTHNHPEGIRGAKAIAAAVYMARKGKTKSQIRAYIEANYYTLDFTLDNIRENFTFSDTCQDTVPVAIVAFLDSTSFEDAIRCAISVGGDTDTIGCMTGAIAEAFYGIPEDILENALSRLDDDLRAEVDDLALYLE